MRHRSYDQLGCPVEACTEVIGAKWKGEILYILFTGTKRYGELRKLIPSATQRVLTLQLRELEEDGIIERKVYPVVPPKVEYSISKRGESLKPIIDAMWHWGKKFFLTLPKERLKSKLDVKAKRMSINRELRDSPNPAFGHLTLTNLKWLSKNGQRKKSVNG